MRTLDGHNKILIVQKYGQEVRSRGTVKKYYLYGMKNCKENILITLQCFIRFKCSRRGQR